MRLAAIYIHKHDFLFNEPQTINLGGKYEYLVIADNENCNELTITKKANSLFVENFFGNEIELITAVVGSNGSGKSSLLFTLLNYFNYNPYDKYDENEYKIVLFYENDNELVVKTKIYVESKHNHFGHEFNIPKHLQLLPEHKKIIYDESKLEIKLKLSDFYDDDTFERTFYYNPLQLNSKSEDSLSISKMNDLLDEIIFFSNQEVISNINSIYKDINFYKSFKVEVNYYSQNFKSTESFINSNYTYEFEGEEKLFSFLENNEYEKDNYYIFFHLYKLHNDIYKNAQYYSIGGVNFYKGLKKNTQLFEIYSQILARLFLYIVSDLELYKVACKKFLKSISQETLTDKIKFLKLLREIINFIYSAKNVKEENEKTFYIFLELFTEYLPESLIIELNEHSVEDNKKFLENYVNIANHISLHSHVVGNRDIEHIVNKFFLVFTPEFNISDGEKFLIKLFSKLYSNNFYNTKMTIGNLLLLDEPELGFHPQWKKKYVDAILKCLPIILGNSKEEKLQIIFTTHDPLTLSDIPNSNIVYLKKKSNDGFTEVLNNTDKPRKSFGANITDLLADSFFIDDGLIGDFAKGKINEVIKWLKDDNRDNDKKDDFKKIIEMIDEPLIKIKLEEMYSSIFKSDLILNKEREFIKRRAIELGLLKEEND